MRNETLKLLNPKYLLTKEHVQIPTFVLSASLVIVTEGL